MKKFYVFAISVTLIICLSATQEEQTFDVDMVEQMYRNDIRQLNVTADSLLQLVQKGNSSNTAMRKAYHDCRYWFKRSEALTEYFYPNTAKLINGALIPEADDEEGTQNIIVPEGLQVIEEFVYADTIGETEQTEFVRTTLRFVSACKRLDQLAAKQQMLDWQIMEAMKQEVIRVFTLGITGFDTPASGKAMEEGTQALDGISAYLTAIDPSIAAKDKKISRELRKSLRNAKKYLTRHADFDSFDRMVFIRDYANPLYGNLVSCCDVLQMRWPQIPSAVNKSARTIFERNALDPWFYARDNRKELQNAEVAALGELLFFDPVLSGDQQRACASCHRPELGFTDGNATSLAFSGNGVLKRNAPTIINAAFQASYFYDVRVNFLEDQIRQVVNNSDELHGNFTMAVSLLKTSTQYRALFAEAFRGTRDTAISSNAIVTAISAYERTLVSNNSRFDKHIRGEGNFMSEEELMGFNLFMGKAQCGTCHFLPMFNGTVPPFYTKSETEIIGVPAVSDTLNPAVDSDPGRLHTSGMNLHRFAFKTPGIRNVALTAPYMHNGIYKTLNEVIDFYNRGGAAGAGETLPTQTLPGEPLGLSQTEKDAIVKFLECLTDTAGLSHRPASLPTFQDAGLNSRKVGGNY